MLNGDSQIARWSWRILLKNFFSRDGVGDGLGDGFGLAGAPVCANEQVETVTRIANTVAQKPNLFATWRWKFITSPSLVPGNYAETKTLLRRFTATVDQNHG